MTEKPAIPAALALIYEVLAMPAPTTAAVAVAYSVAIGNYALMKDHWPEANKAIMEGLGYISAKRTMLEKVRALDRVKKQAWTLYEKTVARLGLPPTAPPP